MSEVQKSYIIDALRDVKHHKALLKILTSDLSDEKVIENLKVVVDYLEFAISTLEAVSRFDE